MADKSQFTTKQGSLAFGHRLWEHMWVPIQAPAHVSCEICDVALPLCDLHSHVKNEENNCVHLVVDLICHKK